MIQYLVVGFAIAFVSATLGFMLSSCLSVGKRADECMECERNRWEVK